MKKIFSWYDILFILLFLYLFILQIHAIWPFTVDDMYISLRYARNWSSGNGLLWNLNAPPVEGYSNFSFVVLGAISLLLHINPVVSLKVAGLFGLLSTTVFVFFITRFWFKSRESLIPCIGLLLYEGEIIWAVSGLETTVFQALLCAAVYFLLRGMGYNLFPASRGSVKRLFFILAGLMFSLAGMTRPEAPALMALFFLLACWDRPKTMTSEYWKGAALSGLIISLVYLPYFLWRWHYYGRLFPNPVYCKGLSNVGGMVLDVEYLKLIWPFILLALPACIQSKDRRHYFLWLPSLVYLLLLFHSDPVVAFDNRLFLPVFALLLPLSLQGLSITLLYCLNQGNKLYHFTFFATAACMAVFFIPGMTLAEYRYFTKNPLAGEHLRFQVEHWLNSYANKSDKVVLADSGLIPYYSNLSFIDSYCLNNAAMAAYPQENRYEKFSKEIMLSKPELVILTSLIEQGQVIYTPGDVYLKKLLIQQSVYKLISTFSTSNTDSKYRYELFASSPNS